MKRTILPASWMGGELYSSEDEKLNLYKPTASVGTEGINISGVWYSFHKLTKRISIIVVNVLDINGNINLNNIVKLPAPSILAASAKLSGIILKAL